MQTSRSRLLRVLVAVAAVGTMSACADTDVVPIGRGATTPTGQQRERSIAPTSSMATITPGLPRDSLRHRLPLGPIAPRSPADTLAVVHGYRARLVPHPTALYHLIWYRDTPVPLDAPPDRLRDTPILFGDGIVIAVGWPQFDAIVRERQLASRLPAIPPPAPAER